MTESDSHNALVNELNRLVTLGPKEGVSREDADMFLWAQGYNLSITIPHFCQTKHLLPEEVLAKLARVRAKLAALRNGELPT